MSIQKINIFAGVALIGLALGLSGCGKAKQGAALALDEARLNVSAARSAGAQALAVAPLKAAEEALLKGEKAFSSRDYAVALSEGGKAARLALEAREAAEKRAAEKKAVKKSGQRAAAKTQRRTAK
jgi:hypothetical protein